MCLITKQLEPIILEEDMEVVKVVNKNLTPYFIKNQPPYELGKLYKINEMGIRRELYIDRLITPFTTTGEGLYMDYIIKYKDTILIIDVGYHSVILNSHLHEHIKGYIDVNILECTIPKGSIIYKNEYGNIVSNQLHVKSIIE